MAIIARTTAASICLKRFTAVLEVSLLFAGLSLLVGCQGVSVGGDSKQLQTNTLSLAATTLDFGNVPSNSNKTMSVMASNPGTASITISSIAISTDYFALENADLPLTIAAGQSANLSIKFTPTSAGTFSASATITSNAMNPVTSVSLTGTGVAEGQGQLTLSPSSENFSNVTVGTKQSQTVSLTNTGSASVDISQASVAGTGFQLSGISTPLTLNALQSTSFTVSFAPTASGNAAGVVTITSDGANPTLTMALSGTGVTPATLSSNPATIAFGSVTVGNKQTVSETITNTGGTSATISQVSASGSGFSISGITVPVTLSSGQSVTFSVAFAPAAAGSASGNVRVSSNASNSTLAISLSGTGVATVGQLAVSPTTIAVGNVVVGTSGTASGSLTASGAAVTVSAASSNNSAFVLSGLSLPVTIASGTSVPFTVIFSPQSTGTASATLTFTSNAQPSTTTGTATGTGTAAKTHSVSLSWNASTSSNISGYNVYRASYSGSCSTFSKINSQLNTSTVYTDSTVTDGDSYCYATTAVNSSQEESGYSNIVSNIQVPAP